MNCKSRSKPLFGEAVGKGVPEDDSPGRPGSGELHAALTRRTATIMSSNKPDAFADMVE
jgi:hypothetical protein